MYTDRLCNIIHTEMKLHQKLLYSDNFSTVLSQKAIKLLLRLCEKFHEVHINILFNIYNTTKLDLSMTRRYDMIYDTRCYFNVCSKADISQLNLQHGTKN